MGWSVFSMEGRGQELSVSVLDVVAGETMEQMAEHQIDPVANASKFLVEELVSLLLDLQISPLAKTLTNTSLMIVHTSGCAGLQLLPILIEVYVIKGCRGEAMRCQKGGFWLSRVVLVMAGVTIGVLFEYSWDWRRIW